MNIPAAMKSAKRWLVWKSLPNADPTKKPRKVPFYPNGITRNGAMDTPEDVAQFGTFDDAMRAMDDGGFTGLGFALGADGTGNHWQGIDLDGMSHRPALSIIFAHLMGMTYCETSPNGDGIHAIGYGCNFSAMGSTADGIEAYSGGRFFTVTGSGLNTLPLHDLHGFIESELRPRRATVEPRSTVEPAALAITARQVADLRSALLSMRSDDRGLWVEIGLALKPLGDAGRALWMEWSAQSDKFDARDAAVTWDSFNTRGTDYRAVFAKAQALGWVNPQARRNPATIFAGGVPPPPPAAAEPVTALAGAVSLQGIEMSLLQLGTQDSVAQIFARQMDGKMLYNHTREKWLEWDGTRWQIEATKKALNFARDLARSVNYEGSRSIGSASFCAGVEQLAKADPVLSAKGTEFDRDNYLLNTPGGTFDLRTNTLRPHNPSDHITMCAAVTPSTEGGAAFDKFLDEITLGDRELSEYLQVSLGACLSGAVESHWMLFWIGDGRNGKNTLGDLVQDAMGDYARKVPTSVLMAKTHEGHPTEIANLQGVRLALSSEINDGEHWHEARINEVTGDGTLSARFMRGDLFTFQRTHKHLIYGNHRPQLRVVGNAITSRMKIVPFRASFLGREDGDLPRRLREHLGYVLAWLIEGHGKWLAAGKRLPSCQAVDAESADYFAAQSTVDMWIVEHVQILTPDARPASQCPKSSDLYRDYANWKKDRGENPISQTRWAETMRKKFQKETSNGVRYRGLMLIPQVWDGQFPVAPFSGHPAQLHKLANLEPLEPLPVYPIDEPISIGGNRKGFQGFQNGQEQEL